MSTAIDVSLPDDAPADGGCRCPEPGWCPYLARKMVGASHGLCRSNSGYGTKLRMHLHELANYEPPKDLFDGLLPLDDDRIELVRKRYPSSLEMAKDLIKEMRAWKAAGSPLRSDADCARLHKVCEACPLFDPEQDRCTDCGCGLSDKARTAKQLQLLGVPNAIRMATKQCPRGRWQGVRWGVGLTTVPARRAELLPRTLASLRAAGFGQPRLFVDGERDGAGWEREFGCPVTCHYPAMLPHGNWYLALAELFTRDPVCDRYALFQDDLVAVKNLKGYLEQCGYPDKGYLNLYTFPDNDELAAGSGSWFASNQLGLGAVGLVFDREAALSLLTRRHMVERPADGRRGWKSVDGGVVWSLRGLGYTEYVHSPSLVQHTGTSSTIGNDVNGPHPQAPSFPGEDFDALTLLKVTL